MVVAWAITVPDVSLKRLLRKLGMKRSNALHTGVMIYVLPRPGEPVISFKHHRRRTSPVSTREKVAGLLPAGNRVNQGDASYPGRYQMTGELLKAKDHNVTITGEKGYNRSEELHSNPLRRRSLTAPQDIVNLHATWTGGVIPGYMNHMIQTNPTHEAFRDHARDQATDRAGAERTVPRRVLANRSTAGEEQIVVQANKDCVAFTLYIHPFGDRENILADLPDSTHQQAIL